MDWEERWLTSVRTGKMGKQLLCGSVDVGHVAVAVAVFGADVVDVDRLAQAVRRASCSEKMHTRGLQFCGR